MRHSKREQIRLLLFGLVALTDFSSFAIPLAIICYTFTIPFETLTDKLSAFVASCFYPLTLAVLAFLIWLLPSFTPWLPAVLFGILVFLPVLVNDGKGYLPVILMMILMNNRDVSFRTIPAYLYFLGGLEILSILLFIILHRPTFQKNYLFFLILAVYFFALISYLYDSIQDGFTGSTGIFFLLSLFGVSVIFLILSNIIGKGDSLSYLCKTVVFFALTICGQILVYGIRNRFTFSPIGFTLGWSYTVQTASTLLCLSLPFVGILISKRRFFWAFSILPIFAAILLLSADSGLLAMILFSVPITLLSLKNTGKNYPYFALFSLVTVVSTFGILMGVSKAFNNRVITAVSALNLFDEPAEWRNRLFQDAIKGFKASPVLGASLNVLIQGDGRMLLPSNTLLTTLTLGGSLSLVAYVAMEVWIYIICFRKNTEDKWLFFVFLLMVELIGLIDNTIYNVAILLFYLIMFTGFQMSNRPEDVIIHENFFLYYNQDKIDNRR